MWSVEPTGQFGRDRRQYEKKRPRELAAVLHNLDRYLDLLRVAPNPKVVQAGYLHNEPKGIVAIDQRGGGKNLEETRLYTFADETEKVVHIITLGNKKKQKSDIEFCKEFVESLRQGQ